MRKADWVSGQPPSVKKGSYRGGKGGRHFGKEVPPEKVVWLGLPEPWWANSVSKA